MKNKIYAKCIQKSNKDIDLLEHDLDVDKLYEVEKISMGQSYTSVYLKNNNKSYNSIYLEFYENNKIIDIFKDSRFNPYI